MASSLSIAPAFRTTDLRIAVVNFGLARLPAIRLANLGLNIQECNETAPLISDSYVPVECDAWLLHCPDEQLHDGPSPTVRRWLETAAATSAGVCVALGQTSESVCAWLSAGADAVAFMDQSDALLAVAMQTAHNAGLNRRKLYERVIELEKKLEVTRLVNQAKSIMAKQLGIPEAEALKRLRQESRNLRRPMAELAKVIIDAEAIVTGTLRTSAPAAKPTLLTRLSPRKSFGNGRDAVENGETEADE